MDQAEPQDAALFDGTVAMNIARFDERASSEAILEAARLITDLHALNGRWPGVTVNVDVVRREFESLLKQSEATNERAAAALDLP